MQPLPSTLTGNLVTLHWLHPSHFPSYHAKFSSLVRSTLHLSPDASYESTRDFLQHQLDTFTPMDMFYCIFDNADNCLIGGIKIRDPQSAEALSNGQLGAWMNEHYWGGGRYQEALRLATQAYFTHTNTESIGAFIDATNTRSLQAHTKFGFIVIGSSKGCCNVAKGVKRIILRLTKP